MSEWTHKTYGMSIVLPHGWKDEFGLEEKCKQAKLCLAHEMDYCFQNYRRYRRGKNRCKFCGVKTNQAAYEAGVKKGEER